MNYLIAFSFIFIMLINHAEAKERERIFSNGGQTINEFDATGALQSSTRLDRDGKLIEKRVYDAHGQIINQSNKENPFPLTIRRTQVSQQRIWPFGGKVCLVQQESFSQLPHCDPQIKISPAR